MRLLEENRRLLVKGKAPKSVTLQVRSRDSMKKLLTAIAAAVFVIYPCVVSASYIIHLKDGREFVSYQYWEEGDQIKFNRYGGVIGIERDLVSGMKLVEEMPEIKKGCGGGQFRTLDFRFVTN